MNNKTLGYIVVVFTLLLLAAPAIYNAAGHGLFASKRAPAAPELERPRNAKECVEPTDYMRKNHQKLLLNERVSAVREGIRTASHSLNNCKSCHKSREKFCDKCHEYIGVKPDCFGCHNLP
ncbi:MAG: cytochrome c [bacterium]|nr:MAG: cytochrome c [bacterium]